MSHRLQLLIPEQLNARLDKAAQRSRVSKGEWVRHVLEESLQQSVKGGPDPVSRLGSLKAPTSDLDRMLAEIEAGRS